MRISDWSSDVCSSDLSRARTPGRADAQRPVRRLPWHAAGVDRGAGAAVRRRHRTGRRDPVRVLVAVTPRDTFAAIAACLVVALLLVPVVRAAEIDPAASHVGFTLKTRWGRTLVGHFPHYEGVVAALPDGRHQVRLRLSAATVEIEDSPTFTRLTRGDGFFEADRFEWVEFVSDPDRKSVV